MFTDMGLYLVGYLIIFVRLWPSSLDYRTAGVLAYPNLGHLAVRTLTIDGGQSCVCMHVSVPMFVLLHSPRCSIRCIFTCFLNLILLLACLVGHACVSELCASILNRHFEPCEIVIHVINVSALCTFKGQPCCHVLSQL